MIRIAIVLGSTRPGRNGEAIARWVYDVAMKHPHAEYELVDIADFQLPLLDEPIPPLLGQYTNAHTKAWSEKIASFDGYIFVSPTYNRSVSGALKNAIDYLYMEWNNKAAGLIGYGGTEGYSSMNTMRLILSELQVAHVRSQISFSLHSDFENYSAFKPSAHHEEGVQAILNEVVTWSKALKTIRNTV